MAVLQGQRSDAVIAGALSGGYADGYGPEAQFNDITDFATDETALYLADDGHNRPRRIQ